MTDINQFITALATLEPTQLQLALDALENKYGSAFRIRLADGVRLHVKPGKPARDSLTNLKALRDHITSLMTQHLVSQFFDGKSLGLPSRYDCIFNGSLTVDDGAIVSVRISGAMPCSNNSIDDPDARTRGIL